MTGPWLKTYQTDVLAGNDRIPDESVDLVVTSPPYKKKDGYSVELMHALGKTLARVLKPGGLVFLNFGQLSSEGFDAPYEARQALLDGSRFPPTFKKDRLQTGQTVIWVKSIAMPSWRQDALELLKLPGWRSGMAAFVGQLLGKLDRLLKGPGRVLVRGHSTPIESPYLLYYNWEFVWIFHKGPRPKLDKLAIGVEYSDKSNLKRGTRGKHGDRRCAGDTWWIPYKTTGATKKKRHAYEYPEELVRRAILLSGVKPGGVLYEPFLGSGTSVCVAKELGLNAYATELMTENIQTATERHKGTEVKRR